MAGVLLDVMRQANEDAGELIPYSGLLGVATVGCVSVCGNWSATCPHPMWESTGVFAMI